jgi:hypothetical protein
MKQSNNKFLSFCIILLSIQGCLGGGSLGSGVSGYGDSSAPVSQASYEIIGKVLDEQNHPLGNAVISVATSQYTGEAAVDNAGKFKIVVKNLSGSPVTFTLKKSSLHTSCTAYISPAGEESVSLSFKLSHGKTLICPK